MAKKNKSTDAPDKLQAASLSIKDVVVADPSIEFTIEIDPDMFKPSAEGVYFDNFTVQMSISNLNPEFPDRLTNVGSISIATLTQTRAYFYFTFGDDDYIAGTKFTLCIYLSAYDPNTGAPVNFTENPIITEVFGGGVPRLNK